MLRLMHTLHSIISCDYFVLKSKDVKDLHKKIIFLIFFYHEMYYIVEFQR